MRTGGLLEIARFFIGGIIRSFGVLVSQGCADIANIIDPPAPKQVEPAPEWNPRLWDRDQDPRTRTEERP